MSQIYNKREGKSVEHMLWFKEAVDTLFQVIVVWQKCGFSVARSSNFPEMRKPTFYIKSPNIKNIL